MFKILGLENVDYTSKTGKRVTGVKMHLGYETEKVNGTAVTDAFINMDLYDKLLDEGIMLEVGTEIELYYNRFGGIAKVDIVK